MPSLVKKNGKSRWRASVMVDGVVRQKLYTDDSKASYREAVKWEAEAKQTLVENKETGTVSWSLVDWANQYLDFARDRFAKHTYVEKRCSFQRLFDRFTPEFKADSVSLSGVMRFLGDQAKARSGYGANKDRKNLATAWKWGRKYLVGFPDLPNPFLAVDRFPEIRSPRYVPPEEDFWKVYQVAEGQDRLMLLVFLHLAARRSEVFRIKWTDVAFHDSRIRLWTKKRLGGDCESDWLPMTTELKESLLWWWEERPIKSEFVFVCLDNTPFCEEYHGKPFLKRLQFMRRMCRKAGVQEFGFHAIRHLTASILYRSGYSVAQIQAVLRHQNPQTTTRYLKTLGLEQTRDVLEQGIGNRGPAKVIPFRKEPRELSASQGSEEILCPDFVSGHKI